MYSGRTIQAKLSRPNSMLANMGLALSNLVKASALAQGHQGSILAAAEYRHHSHRRVRRAPIRLDHSGSQGFPRRIRMYLPHQPSQSDRFVRSVPTRRRSYGSSCRTIPSPDPRTAPETAG
jgi:hypothetical protein